MTKRILDADALLRWIKATKGLFDDETLDDFYLSTLNKINELATPAPEPQESIFDAEGWCYELDKAFDCDDNFLIFYIKDFGILPAHYNSYFASNLLIEEYCVFENLHDRTTVNVHNFIAWRPLPKLLTGGKND